MRHQLMVQLTSRQSQVVASVTAADVDNDQTDETEATQVQVTAKTAEKTSTNYADRLFIHYTHEKRFEPFKRDMHQLYNNK